METALIKGRKSFFGVTMTDFDPVDHVGSIMCCQDQHTFISIVLTGLDTPIPSGSPFFASGDPQGGTDAIWQVDIENQDHRWLVFDKKYVTANFILKVDNALIKSQSDKKPVDDAMFPAALNYKKLRKNMINFRIIKTELQREDMSKYQINAAPKYIAGKAYFAYFRIVLVST